MVRGIGIKERTQEKMSSFLPRHTTSYRDILCNDGSLIVKNVPIMLLEEPTPNGEYEIKAPMVLFTLGAIAEYLVGSTVTEVDYNEYSNKEEVITIIRSYLG